RRFVIRTNSMGIQRRRNNEVIPAALSFREGRYLETRLDIRVLRISARTGLFSNGIALAVFTKSTKARRTNQLVQVTERSANRLEAEAHRTLDSHGFVCRCARHNAQCIELRAIQL